MSINFKPIHDNQTKNKLRELVAIFIDDDFKIKKEWLHAQKFFAVPVEEAYLEDNLKELYLAVKKNVYSLLYIALLNKFNYEKLPSNVVRLEEFYKLELDPQEFDMLRYLRMGGNFVVFPFNLAFVILLTDAEFSVICGEKIFLEAVLGCSIEAARQKFIEYANTKTWSIKEMAWYKSVGKFYEEISK